MAAQNLESIVDGLLALPFPRNELREGDRVSGPDYHVRTLRASQDFWEDRSEDVVQAAEDEIDAAFQTLVTALTARWGEPEAIDLAPYLWSEDPVPEPVSRLAQVSGEMLLWRRSVRRHSRST